MKQKKFELVYQGAHYSFLQYHHAFVFAKKGNKLSNEITVEDALITDGCFFFLAGKETPLPELTQEQFALLELWCIKQSWLPGLVWVRIWGESLASWQFWSLKTSVQEKKRQLAQKDSIGYYQYRLALAGGTTISWLEDKEQFQLENKKQAAVFCNPVCMYPLDGPLIISCAETACGQFQGTFSVSEEQSEHFFQDMQIGLCYQTLQQPDEWEDSVYTMQACPQIVIPCEYKLKLHMMPNDPLSKEQTWLSLANDVTVFGLFQDIYGNDMPLTLDSNMKYVFQPQIQGIQKNEDTNIYIQKFYLTLEGAFSLCMKQSRKLQKAEILKKSRILCGLNGNEFFCGAQDTADITLNGWFHAANPAFFPATNAPDMGKATTFAAYAQTAYLSFDENANYYSQAPQMRLFTGTSLSTELKKNAWLEPYDFALAECSQKIQIPYFPYHSMETVSKQACFSELETMLNSRRLSLMNEHKVDQTRNRTQLRTTTRCGLLAGWKNAYVPEWIGIYDCERIRPSAEADSASDTEISSGRLPDVRFTNISREFFGKLLEKEVFLFYSDKTKLLEEASTPCYVDAAAFQTISREFPGKDVSMLQETFFETETQFLDKVMELLSVSVFEEQTKQTLLQAAADLSVEAAGWNFQLSPRCFRTNTDGTDTVLFIKYTKETTIADWIQNNPNKSCRILYEKAAASPEKYSKLWDILTDKTWCGFLYLNVPVSATRVQEELSFLLEGIDTQAFYATYVAIGENHVKVHEENSALTLQPGGISAFIDYEDLYRNDQCKQDAELWFRTVSLKLDIQESQIIQFKSTSELTIEKMFESNVKKQASTSGNAMIMDGSCQIVEGMARYLFQLKSPACYECEAGGIKSFWVNQVNFICGSTRSIHLSGSLLFYEEKTCDILSFGTDSQGLGFELQLEESGRYWKPNYTSLCINAAQNGIRENSLVHRFAADFLGFWYETQKSPKDMGYQSIICPIKQGTTKLPVFMMTFRIHLGGLGAISDTAGLCSNLCAAWSIENGKTNWFIGMQLKEGTNDKTFSLQSLLSVRIKSIALCTQLQKEQLTYYLELRNFRISLAGYEFPNRSTQIMVFANPDNPAQKGWYAVT